MFETVQITQSNFQNEVIKENKLVLVDFWASWCVPCKVTEPIIDELAREMKGKVKFCKVNVETDGDIANRYSVRGVPTFLLFRNGEVINQITSGTIKKDQFKAILDQYLSA